MVGHLRHADAIIDTIRFRLMLAGIIIAAYSSAFQLFSFT